MTNPARLSLLGPWPPPYGGVAVHVARLRELLVENGYEPRVLSFDASALSAGHDMHLLEGGLSRLPSNVLTLARVVGRKGVLHNHSVVTSYPSRQSLGPLLFAVKSRQASWVETVHDQTITVRFPSFSTSARRLFVRAMTNAAKIIAIGDDLRAFLVDVGIAPSKVVVGHPLLPARPSYHPLPDRLAPFFGSRSPVWITVGAFIPLYDFGTVARAFRRFAEANRASGLVVVSSSFARNETYEAEVRAVLHEIPDKVLFLEDLPPHEMEAVLRASSVLIRGPRHESFGLSRVEALLAGVPVVATNTGQTRFMTLYTHGAPDSLIAGVNEALQTGTDTLRAAAAYYARMASDSFKQLVEVYEELGAPRRLDSDER